MIGYGEYGSWRTKTRWLYTLGLWDTGAMLDMNSRVMSAMLDLNSRVEFETHINRSEHGQ